MATGQTRPGERWSESVFEASLELHNVGQEAVANRDHAPKLEHGQLAVHKCALSSSARRSHQAPRWPSPVRRIKAAQGDAMKWLKEKPPQVVKLEQELHQVREQITQLNAREKELASKLKVEESKQGSLTRSKVTQAKMLAGMVLMKLWDERLEGKEALRQHISERVTKQAERDLFGDEFWCEGGMWKMNDKKQERRRWIILGAIFLDHIDFEETNERGKLSWSKMRSFFERTLVRNDHRRLFGLSRKHGHQLSFEQNLGLLVFAKKQ
jgi:hypothetical protein